MFHNSKGKLVPHCEDCMRYQNTCPDNALDIVDPEKGVVDCPGYMPLLDMRGKSNVQMKRVSFRIRRIYYDQIVNGTKVVELRKLSDHWKRILLGRIPPDIAVFVCGKDVHRRWIKGISIEIPEQVLGRELSEQGKKDVSTAKCIATWLGDVYEPQEKH